VARDYRWDDEARVLVWPGEPGIPHYHSDLASCVTKAIEVATSDTKPARVEIEHASGIIALPEIEALARDPSFPSNLDVYRVRTDSEKP
jgi:hypothetical protein